MQRINTFCSLIYMSSCLPARLLFLKTFLVSTVFHSACLTVILSERLSACHVLLILHVFSSAYLAACQFACIPVCLAIYSICYCCDDRQYVYSMYMYCTIFTSCWLKQNRSWAWPPHSDRILCVPKCLSIRTQCLLAGLAALPSLHVFSLVIQKQLPSLLMLHA